MALLGVGEAGFGDMGPAAHQRGVGVTGHVPQRPGRIRTRCRRPSRSLGKPALSHLPGWARCLTGLLGLLGRRCLRLHLHFNFPGLPCTARPSLPQAARRLLPVTCPWLAAGLALLPAGRHPVLFGPVRVRLCCWRRPAAILML